ncbi:MAG: hypothetical protein OEY59_12455, partial [Deltaproteobacteria bacterium]|nr:hypothetical protein [Deltaproteobacteria bacterium]
MAYLSINCTFCDRKGDFHLTVDFVYSVKPPSDVGYIPDRESQPLALKSVCPTCQHPIFVLTKFKHDARKWALSSFDKDPRNPNCKHIDRSNETDLATLYFQHEHGQLNQLVDPSEIQVFPTPAPRFTHPSIPEHIAKEFRELENIMTVLE